MLVVLSEQASALLRLERVQRHCLTLLHVVARQPADPGDSEKLKLRQAHHERGRRQMQRDGQEVDQVEVSGGVRDRKQRDARGIPKQLRNGRLRLILRRNVSGVALQREVAYELDVSGEPDLRHAQ